MIVQFPKSKLIHVAPHAGAWIEILADLGALGTAASLPMRERGLKFRDSYDPDYVRYVAPHAGAWIEINHQAVQRLA